MRARWITGTLLAICASGGAAMLVQSHASSPAGRTPAAARPGRPDVPALRSLAVRSCSCERHHAARGEKDACWKPFFAAVKPWQEGEEQIMLCGDPTEHSIALTSGETIVTRYLSERDAAFCTAEEAHVAQGAYTAAEDARERNHGGPSGNDVLDRLSREFAVGRKALAVSNVSGCTSG